MAELDNLLEKQREREIESADLSFKEGLNLLSRKVAKMQQGNALENFKSFQNRAQSDYALKQAEVEKQGGVFNYEAEINNYESSVRKALEDLNPFLDPTQKKAMEFDFETGMNNIRAKALEEMGKQEAKKAKDTLDMKGIEFKNAVDSRDSGAIEGAYNSLTETLDNLHTSGSVDDLQYEKLKDSYEDNFKEARIEALEDAYDTAFYKEGAEEAEKIVDSFIKSKDFENFNMDQRAKVFKLARRAMGVNPNRKEIKALKKTAKDMKKRYANMEEDYYKGKNVSYNDIENSNLRAQELNAMAIVKSKDKNEKRALALENSMLKMDLVISNNFNKNFISFLGKDTETLIDELDKDSGDIQLKNNDGSLTEVGIHVREKLNTLQSLYDHNTKETSEFIENYVKQYFASDPQTQDSMDERVKIISASAGAEWNSFVGSLENPLTQKAFEGGIGRNIITAMSVIEVRKAMTGRYDILDSEAQKLFVPLNLALSQGDVEGANAYMEYLRNQGISLKDVFESHKDLSNVSVLQTLNLAEQADNPEITSHIFQSLKALNSENEAVQKHAVGLLTNIQSKVAKYVNSKSLEELGFVGSKSEALSFLTLATAGIFLRDGDKFPASLNYAKQSFKDILNENKEVASLVSSLNRSKAKVGGNVFVKKRNENKIASSLLSNSFDFRGEGKTFIYKNEEGRRREVKVVSPAARKEFLSIIFHFGKAPKSSVEDIKNNYKVDDGYLYERTGRKGNWTRVLKKDGSYLRMNAELLNAMDYNLEENGVFSDFKKKNEEVVRKTAPTGKYGQKLDALVSTVVDDSFSDFIKWNTGFSDKEEIEKLQQSSAFISVLDKMLSNSLHNVLFDEGPVYFMGEDIEKGTAFDKASKEGKEGRKRADNLNKVKQQTLNTFNWTARSGGAKLKRTVDGDTFDIEVDHPTKGKVDIRFRVYKLNTAELGDNSFMNVGNVGDATEALEEADKFLKGGKISITYRGLGKFNRALANIKVGNKDFREYMISKGYGVHYDYKPKK